MGLADPNAIKDIFAVPCFALPTMLYIHLGGTRRDDENHEYGLLRNA